MEKRIKIDNKEFEYIEIGKKSYQTMLLIPGWAGTYSNYGKIIDDLSEKFRIIGVNLPGTGESEQLNVIHNPENYSLWLEKFIKKLNLKNVYVLADSLGAETALYFVNNSKLTKNISKLTLVALPVLPPFYIKMVCRFLGLISVLPFSEQIANFVRFNDILIYLHGKVLCSNNNKKIGDFLREQKAKSKLSTNKVFLETAGNAFKIPVIKYLNKTKNIQLIYGENDVLLNKKKLVDINSNVKITFTKGKHKPYVDSKAEFLEAVTNF